MGKDMVVYTVVNIIVNGMVRDDMGLLGDGMGWLVEGMGWYGEVWNGWEMLWGCLGMV